MHEIALNFGEDISRLISFVQEHKEYGLIHLIMKEEKDEFEFDLGFADSKKDKEVFLHAEILRYALK